MIQRIRLSGQQKRKLTFLLLSFSILTITIITTALIAQALPILTATKQSTLLADNNNNSKVDPGDTIRYTVALTNSGSTDATSVNFADTIDSNTTLVAGSVKTSPIARHDSYPSIGNVGISVPAGSGVLANDNDPDGGSVSVIPAAGGTANGGAFSIGSDGAFSYLPPAGFEGADSFTYTIQDSDGNQDPATVFITVNEVIWFIDNSQPGPGTGVLSNPFSNIANFNASAADEDGDIIFIYETGNGVYTADIPLLNNQTVIGQGASASIASIAGITIPPFSNALPSTGGSRPVLGNSFIGVRIQQNNTLSGFDIGNSTVGGAGIANVPQNVNIGTLTINDMAIGGTGRAILLTGDGTLAVTLDSVTTSGGAHNGIGLLGNTGPFTGNFTVTGATTINNTLNIGVNIFNSNATHDFGNTSVTNVPATAINLNGNTSGSFNFDTLTVSTSSGTGLQASNSGTVTVLGSGNTVSATNGAAINLTNTTIGASGITLQSASASGADTGITLNNTGTGDFTVTGVGTTDGSGGTLNNLNDHGIELINAQDVSISNMNLTNAATTQDVAVNTATCDDESGGTNTACNAPVQMVNSSNISLTNLTINGSVQHGINGNNVNGLSISNTDVSNIGNDQLENGMHIINLLGTVNFNNLNIDGSETRNVLIENNTGTANITVTNSSFNNTTSANGEDGFHLIGSSSANVTLNVNNSSFIHNHGPQLKAHAEDSSTVNATIVDNLFDGEPSIVGNTGLDLAVRDNADLIFNVSGTTLGDQVFQPIRGQVINVFALGNGTASGRINRNDINGSNQASGIRVVSSVTTSGNPNVTVEIDGNDIDGISGFGNAGIHIDSRNGVAAATGTANVQATINNNDVTISGADSIIQAYLNSGNTMCLDVTNNTTAGAATSPYAGAGSTHYIGNPVSGTSGGAGNLTYDGYIANDLGGTWNANGNSPALAAGIAGEAYVDGTQPINGTCATVAQIDTPTVVVASTINRADVWAFVDERDEIQASHLNNAVADNQSIDKIVVNEESDSAVAVATKQDTLAKPAESGETINLDLGTLNPGQVVVITFDVTVDNPTAATSVCNQGVFSADNHVNLLTDDPTIGGVSDPTCDAVELPPVGTIQIIKDTVPDVAQDFNFTTSGGLTPATFDLDDDADGTLSNTQTFSDITPGAYTVTETAVSGYTTTLSCVDPDGGTTTVGATATIDLDADETVICTFTNTAQPGTINIIKDTVPDSAQDFSFTTAGGLIPATFDLDDDADGTLSNTQTFNNVSAGTYSVTETAVSGYTTTLSCVDPSGGTITAGNTATIDLAPGETVTCTFTNTVQTGTLTVIKNVMNDNGGTAVPSDFTMNISGNNPSQTSFPGNASGVAITLEPGAYNVTESGPSGYVGSFSADCSGNIAAGENKTCTITNDDIQPTITINKVLLPATDNGTFDLLIDNVVYATGGDGATTGAVAVNAGSYTVSEQGANGTNLAYYNSAIGGDCAADGSITVDIGDNAVCTITNTTSLIYVSVHTHGQVDNGNYYVNDEDIVSYAQASDTWAMVFDGDDVYVDLGDVNAFHILPDNSILMSFDAPKWVEGVGDFDDSDIVRFIPTQLGNNTSGTWELYFDGSDVGLSKGSDDIDAISFAPDGRLVISTKGEFDISGLTGSGHDLLVFNDTSLGWTTSGTFEMYFDGSDVGLTTTSEDIWGVWIDPDTNDIYLTTKANFSVTGLSGKGSDVFICTPSSLGANTSCTFTFFWDGTSAGLNKKLRLDGIHIQ